MALQVHRNENCVVYKVALGIFASVGLNQREFGMNGKIFLFCPFKAMLIACIDVINLKIGAMGRAIVMSKPGYSKSVPLFC